MNLDTNLQFIRERINHLGQAIMYNNSQNVIKMPNNIIQAIDVDEEGQLWFTAKRPEYVSECDQYFPAQLHFYRKGISYYVQVSGKASIVNYAYGQKDEEKMLLKMGLNEVVYMQPEAEKKPNRLSKWMISMYNWATRTIAINHRPAQVFPKIQQPSL